MKTGKKSMYSLFMKHAALFLKRVGNRHETKPTQKTKNSQKLMAECEVCKPEFCPTKSFLKNFFFTLLEFNHENKNN